MSPLGIWLLLANLAGFVLMGEDKCRAIAKARRIPERTLLLAAALGGAAGVLAGMVSYNHKTRHKRFSLGVPAILLIHLLLGAWVVFRVYFQ